MRPDFKEIMEAESGGFPNALDVASEERQRSAGPEISFGAAAWRVRSPLTKAGETGKELRTKDFQGTNLGMTRKCELHLVWVYRLGCLRP